MQIWRISRNRKMNSNNIRDAINQTQTLKKNKEPVGNNELTHSCQRLQTHRYPAIQSPFSQCNPSQCNTHHESLRLFTLWPSKPGSCPRIWDLAINLMPSLSSNGSQKNLRVEIIFPACLFLPAASPDPIPASLSITGAVKPSSSDSLPCFSPLQPPNPTFNPKKKEEERDRETGREKKRKRKKKRKKTRKEGREGGKERRKL